MRDELTSKTGLATYYQEQNAQLEAELSAAQNRCTRYTKNLSVFVFDDTVTIEFNSLSIYAEYLVVFVINVCAFLEQTPLTCTSSVEQQLNEELTETLNALEQCKNEVISRGAGKNNSHFNYRQFKIRSLIVCIYLMIYLFN